MISLREHIDLVAESNSLIALTDVPRHLPARKGKRVHYSTVFRWVTKGARGRILESVMIGGVRFTTAQALNRFVASECHESHRVAADSTIAQQALAAVGL